jgi:hypothetical protein
VTSDGRPRGAGNGLSAWSQHALGVFTGRGALARLCVVYVVVVSLAVVAIELPKRLGGLGDVSAANASLSYADREIAGGNSVIADQLLAYEARAILPRDASYRVVVGVKLTKQASLSTASVPGWLRYFLMPRRQDDGARWVVCYGCDPARLGAGYEALWSDDFGISVGRLK